MADKIKMAVAALLAVRRACAAFYSLADSSPLIVRVGALLGAFARGRGASCGSPQPGKRVLRVRAGVGREEAKRVVWPTRKETLQTTGIVFAFVVVMALFLWIVDAGLLWVTQKLLGTGS